ncbi:hypothetical protein ASPWEDRAFT_141408 [Aspergillus wentii DTO 134E9]|uniref:ABC multidrug transporter MDR2 n=1 Tax=Aspergillus wentii DTO 134E9 TaxID=1073089 RepID=A0A1L9R8K6_ASPWE|nr:uncharacterized protein ASPWEDRAFT_141408 [Aspergillus wentii DTO 134E9]OJJ31256.1 hypothetical protein ASPWEDRAFT_141408 [Aspergillus wentii DTO 134E9]
MGTSSEEKPTQPDPDPAENESENETQDVEGGGFSDYLRIFKYADKWDWTLNTISLIASIASGSVMPLMTIVFGQFTTKFSNFSTGSSDPDQFKSDVNRFSLWFIYLFIAKAVLSYIATMTITISAIRTTRSIRQAFLEHLLRMEIWHFDLPGNGAPATQVTTNANRINTGIAEKLSLAVQAVAMFGASFIIAIVIQWKLALITLSAVPVILIITMICIAIDAGLETKIVRLYSQGAVLAQEVLSSIKTVHSLWAQERMIASYDEYLCRAREEGNKKSLNYGVMFSVEYFCVYSATALAFWQGFRMFRSGEVEDIGKIFTVVLSVMIASSSITVLAPQITALTNAAAAASELFGIMDKKSSLDPLAEGGVKKDNDSCTGQIEVSNVDFAYPSRPAARVLHNFNISIPAGKTTALVGASGSGKSTMIGLLERWYTPLSGSIKMDGVEIADYNTKWLRTRVRLVQQEPVLFRGTIFENVAKGLVEEQKMLSREEQVKLVEEACRASYAHDFILEQPKGYDTFVSERAGTLSGGQKQRIAIARSIVSNPTILLLDEATSALDPKSEKVVQEALNHVSKGRTTIAIAHRLSTIKDADSIAVMANGCVVEQGTHDELVARDGHYAKLVRAQDLGNYSNGDEWSSSEDVEEEEMLSVKQTVSSKTVTADAIQADEGMKDKSLITCIFLMLLEQKSLFLTISIALIACVAAAGTFPGQAVLFSRLINAIAIDPDANNTANFYSLMFFVVALGNLVVYFVLGILSNIIAQSVTHRYRLEMFQHMIHMDMAFFDRPENSSGALTSKLSTGPASLQDLMSFNLFVIVVIVVNVVASSCLALGYGWKLGLVVVFAGLPPLIGSGYLRVRLETKLDDDNAARFAESAGLANEAVGAIRTVASLTLESGFIEQYTHMLAGVASRSIRVLSWIMIPYALSQSLEFLVMALGFWYGSRLLANGEYTTEQFYVIFIGVIFAGQAAAQFFGFSTSLTKAKTAANYLFWLRSVKPVVQETDENKDNGPDSDTTLALTDVEFSYPQREDRVLKGVSMNIQPGQFVAFVGASGCGKSTLVSLLERYYDPTSGTIAIGNKDIKSLSPRLYRSHISLVQQEPVLYQGTVKDNITMGLSTAPTDDQLHKACHQANAFDFIVSLPQGFNTPCGARGMSFSGGQRQRITIARALIRNPQLLLLDEATSALDTQSEKLVQAALDEAAKAGRTMIAVAHRLSTIRGADVIYVFAGGRIVEMGTHEELQRLRGRYYEMCLSQSLDRAV